MQNAGYGEFAEAYDALTFNVPYDELAEYYRRILRSLSDGKKLLDLGCGTGNLTVRLADMGFQVIGQDASEEMLTLASGKSDKVRWMRRDMTKTRLTSPADMIISTLDSINHLKSAEDISECFKRAFENLKPGGAFVFDVNTVYKHREVLGNNTFVYDLGYVYCVWQNEFCPGDNGVDIELDMFFEKGKTYTRGYESFREIALSEEEYRRRLEQAGFEVVNVWEYPTFSKPTERSEKLLISAKKR